MDPFSELLILCAKNKMQHPTETCISAGTDHEPEFVCTLDAMNKTGIGSASNKKTAKQLAAKHLLEQVGLGSTQAASSTAAEHAKAAPQGLGAIAELRKWAQRNLAQATLADFTAAGDGDNHLFTWAASIGDLCAFGQHVLEEEAMESAASKLLDLLSSPVGPAVAGPSTSALAGISTSADAGHTRGEKVDPRKVVKEEKTDRK